MTTTIQMATTAVLDRSLMAPLLLLSVVRA